MRKEKDWSEFDCALSYGLVEYLKILDMIKEFGWSTKRCIPHGGHQMSLAIAAGLNLGEMNPIQIYFNHMVVFQMEFVLKMDL